jgi:hypothetical protein
MYKECHKVNGIKVGKNGNLIKVEASEYGIKIITSITCNLSAYVLQ